jgi:hypothetical protein
MAQPSYDKYDPIASGFRGRLAADLTLTNGSFLGGVSLNASGKVVVGTAGQSGLVGVLLKNAPRSSVGQFSTPPGAVSQYAPIATVAGSQVDIMQFGEINGLDTTAFPAGTKVYTTAAGVIAAGGVATGRFLIGFTIEAGRLRVNCPAGLVAQA